MHQVITIGRQFGSGGTEIAHRLAQLLDLPCYDKESLREYTVEHGLGKALLDSYREKHASSLLLSLSTSAYSFGYFDASQESSIGQKSLLTAFETIKEVGRAGPCIICGRCADFVLQNRVKCLNIFIHAPLQDRIQRVSRRMAIDEVQAGRLIAEQDRLRKSYYNYYTTKNWGEPDSYHLTMDSSYWGTEETAVILAQLFCTGGLLTDALAKQVGKGA